MSFISEAERWFNRLIFCGSNKNIHKTFIPCNLHFHWNLEQRRRSRAAGSRPPPITAHNPPSITINSSDGLHFRNENKSLRIPVLLGEEPPTE